MPEKLAKRVVLATWPAADWGTISRLLCHGALPHLRQLVGRGALGRLAGLIHTSLITGVTADRHGVLSAGDSNVPRTKTLCNILSEAGMRSIAVNWTGQPVAAMQNESWDFAAVSFDLKIADDKMRWPALDAMLGQMIGLAGDNATIVLVSARGMRRCALASIEKLLPWYSTLGFCCIAGPRTKRNEFLQEASLLDIAPTILYALGLPVGRDMQGRPRTQAFLDPPSPVFVKTWDNGAAQEGSWTNTAKVERERKLNCAAVYLDTARPQQAIAVLGELLEADPKDETCGLLLAYAYTVMGEWEQLRELLAELPESECTAPWLAVMKAGLSVAGGNVAEALGLLKQAERATIDTPMLAYGIGSVYIRLKKWRRAERAFRMAAERCPEFWPAREAQAMALDRIGKKKEATELARANFHMHATHASLLATLIS